MSDTTIRDAERRWRETGDVESAAVYLRALERAGLLPDQVPVDIPTVSPPITVAHGPGADAVSIGIPGVGHVLVSYSTPVAALLGAGQAVWSPTAAHSRTSRRHVSMWLNMNLDDIEEVTPERLVDLLRLVPISEFWPTCDGCLEPRREVKRQDDGRDLCGNCEAAAALPGMVAQTQVQAEATPRCDHDGCRVPATRGGSCGNHDADKQNG